VIRAGYAPSVDDVHWARAVLAAAANERGVFAFDGKMVDAPVLRRAERIVHLAGEAGS
jgi:citrate lyase subunit beta / citryl-CoA lyase